MTALAWLPATILLISGAALGAVFGSFFSAVLYRLPRRIDLVRGRSMCPCCRHQIPNRYNIPVIGWIMLRGRCSACKERISLRYPLLELLWAGLGSLGAWYLGLITTYLIVVLLIICAAVASICTRRVDGFRGEDSAGGSDSDVGSGV